MITPEELRALLKKHRWSIAIGKCGNQSVYAAKRRAGKKLATCYIGTSNRLNILTEEEIVAKIIRSEAMRLAQKRSSNDQAHTDQCQPQQQGKGAGTSIIPASEAQAN